jgi:transcriptional regulator with XRE-family HTH domain
MLKTFCIFQGSISDNFVPLSKSIKINFIKMKNLGDTLRELREGKQQPLRTVAAYLDIDQAILSRIERGQRKASREQVLKLAEYFNVDEDDLLVAWLSDKVVYEVLDEDIALQALRVAEEKVKYNKTRTDK